MAVRALIIAVENYPHSAGLATKLDGTLDNGEAFKEWVVQNKGVNPAQITLLKDATRVQIDHAFRDLVDAGRDSTEELYAFFSGHGFTFNDTPFRQKPADVIVGSEFEDLQNSGDACLRLNDIQLALWQCLGPGTHYYFVDACRNLVAAGKVIPANLSWAREPSVVGEPRVFTLFSTERGSIATVSGFAPALVDALSGKGRAKMRDGFDMFVTFDSVCCYLEGRLGQKIQPDPGGGVGRILQITPIPSYQCGVRVNQADAADVFTVVVHNALRQLIYGPQSFQGPQTDFTQAADDYYVQVTHPQFSVSPANPVKADMYEDCAVQFQKTNNPLPGGMPRPAAPPPPLPGQVELRAPANTRLLIHNITTGRTLEHDASFEGSLDPGDYDVRVTEPGWTSVRKLRFKVDPGEKLVVDAGSREPTAVKDALVAAIPGGHDAERVDFSESLGPMANQDLGLWLSLIGASRILSEWGGFNKLSALPLSRFDDVKPGDAPSYILLGFESLPSLVNVAIHAPWQPPDWQSIYPVAGLEGVFEYRLDLGPGLHLVSLRLPEKAPLTTVVYNIPNRATLFVAADDEADGMRIHQYVLPLAKLEGSLTEEERLRQPPNSMAAIRFMTLAQRQMARRRPIRPPETTASAEDRNLWTELLYGKWLDPVMAIMAAYELVRTGSFPMGQDETGAVTLSNLRRFFSVFPDVEVIAKLAKVDYREPEGVPLFLIGLVPLETYLELLPLPASHLDTTGPWVTWLSAVS